MSSSVRLLIPVLVVAGLTGVGLWLSGVAGAAVEAIAETRGAAEDAGPADRLGPAQKLADLDASVDESSGLASSLARPGWLWTHNDSGGGPWLTLFSPLDGETERFKVAGVENRDWEDLAAFERDGRRWLVVADTGDNLRNQRAVSLHLIPEPAADDAGAAVLHPAATLRFTFADGPRDCEAVAVDPAGQAAWVLSKEIDNRGQVFGRAGLYRLPLPAELRAADAAHGGPGADDPNEVVVLQRLATLDTVMPTAMDISPDGRFLLIATYVEGLLYERPDGATWDRVLADTQPQRILLPPRRQGEALCFAADGSAVYLTSEKPSQPVWRLPFDGR